MSAYIGKYKVIRTIGSGASCKVKLAKDSETGRKVAIKILNDDVDDKMKELVLTEVESMSKLNHSNIISQLEYGVGTYVKPSGKSKEVQYIVLELALGGELFDFVSISGRFEEPLARYYFKEFMSGVQYCHANGVAHRDLKPENLLLDHQFTLKIADFGFAGPINGRDGSGTLTTKLGTANYMAPEIHLQQPYKGEQVDIFSSAIILFIMVAQHPPFTAAIPSDPFYRCLASKRSDIFWRTHCKSKPEQEKFFSEEFKDLIEKMLKLEPADRPSLQDILSHPWMTGPEPSKEEIIQEFAKRNQIVKKQADEEQKSKDQEKHKRSEKKRAMRSAANGDEDEMETGVIGQPKKQLEEYEELFSANTMFFSTYHPDMIEDALRELFKKKNLTFTSSDKKYKMKFSVNDVDFSVRLLKVDESKTCVEF